MTSDSAIATAPSAAAQKRQRPLSPHLQIYRWQHTMLTSILHRATGIALTAGLPVLVWWLARLAGGRDSYAQIGVCLGSCIGQVLLIGWSWSFFYHLSAGLRHLVWDSGKGFSLPVARKTSYLVLSMSVVLTIGFWIALALKG